MTPEDLARIDARHREPHKCQREDISSACDWNRYGSTAIATLGQALAKYGARHLADCRASNPSDDCTCGLNAALACR